ncbi:MAG TPA: hypothetical protein DER02_03690 [Gammaproteobacteria bacterium]|nr:hypothetical protein [Gammaproteobacteria bacterium]
MQERVRYRLTGALFLLAVAALLLPMMFDSPAPDYAGIQERTLPKLATHRPDTEAKLSNLDMRQQSQAVPDFDAVADSGELVEQTQELRASIDEDGFNTADGTRFGEAVLLEPDANTKFFAVQAASFSVMSNARGFLQRLRSAGYDAFLSTGKVDAGLSSALTGSQQVMHRVVVGPLLSRSRAEQIRDELQDKLRVEARIVAMRQ